jgi:hypothetical protein
MSPRIVPVQLARAVRLPVLHLDARVFFHRLIKAAGIITETLAVYIYCERYDHYIVSLVWRCADACIAKNNYP